VNRACTGPFASLPFCDTTLPIDARVALLVRNLTTAEKVSVLTARHSSPVSRLGIPAYDWGVNSIHGDQVSCGTNCATNYPLPVAIGASFNRSLVVALGRMMGVELRALRLEHACEKHVSAHPGTAAPRPAALPDPCIGLDTWAPNINLNRDPRWGRNWEVASSDPYLTGEIGKAYAVGFQEGTDPHFLLGVLTIKHWAAYNVENQRNSFNAVVSKFDLTDSYLRGWRTAVVDGKAAGVMCSYNALNGVPTCANGALNSLLRDTWKFDGYITSDSGAVGDVFNAHHYVKTGAEAAAACIAAGTDINSGSVYHSELANALEQHLINESQLDAAVAHSFRVRMRLGLFDPFETQPYYGPEIVGSSEHHQLSYEASLQGLTLLSNKAVVTGGPTALPLKRGRKIAVIGGNAQTKTLMAGGTGGGLLSAEVVCKNATSATDWWCIQSPFDAIQEANGNPDLTSVNDQPPISGTPSKADVENATRVAQAADAVVFVIGGDWGVEHEGMDRASIDLPGSQTDVVSTITASLKAGVPVVTVLVHGGSMDISRIVNVSHAVLDAFYPGMHGGAAIAATLFGDASPGGKLPYTYYRAEYAARCEMDDFAFAKPECPRGYRYLDPADKDIIFPFGYGLSYTTFTTALAANSSGPLTLPNDDPSSSITLALTVTNTGKVRGAETVLVYFTPHNKTNPGGVHLVGLQKQLAGYAKVDLEPGATSTETITLTAAGLARANANGDLVSMVGGYTILLSTGNPAAKDIAVELAITGTDLVLESLPVGL